MSDQHTTTTSGAGLTSGQDLLTSDPHLYGSSAELPAPPDHQAPDGQERTGHGHVTPQPGGPARCGGPRLCPECAEELRIHDAAREEARRRDITEAVNHQCGILYSQQTGLLAVLASLWPATLAHGNDPAWEVLTVEGPAGQMCWSVSVNDLEPLRHVPWSDQSVRYDGHSTEEKFARLGSTVQALLAELREAKKIITTDQPDPVAATLKPFVTVTVPDGMTGAEVAARVATAFHPTPTSVAEMSQEELATALKPFITVTAPDGMTEEELGARVAAALYPAPAPVAESSPEELAAASWARIGAAIGDVLRAELGDRAVCV